jgi:hypothetical protein
VEGVLACSSTGTASPLRARGEPDSMLTTLQDLARQGINIRLPERPAFPAPGHSERIHGRRHARGAGLRSRDRGEFRLPAAGVPHGVARVIEARPVAARRALVPSARAGGTGEVRHNAIRSDQSINASRWLAERSGPWPIRSDGPQRSTGAIGAVPFDLGGACGQLSDTSRRTSVEVEHAPHRHAPAGSARAGPRRAQDWSRSAAARMTQRMAPTPTTPTGPVTGT